MDSLTRAAPVESYDHAPQFSQYAPAPDAEAYSYDTYDDSLQPPAEDDLFDEDDDELEAYAPPPTTVHEETLYIPAPAESLEAVTAPAYTNHPGDQYAATSSAIDDSTSLQAHPDTSSLFLDDFTPNAEPIVETPITTARPSAAPANAPTGPRSTRRPAQPQPTNRPHPSHASTAPSDPHLPGPASTPSTAPSVKGDRSATGAAPRPKLTDSELAARMASIALKNATRQAAHERAEADKQTFAAREQEAQAEARRRDQRERQNRQQMMGERERWRERKLQSMASRDWEAGKAAEEEVARGGRRGRGRGGDGGRGRGRGGRGGGAGRGGESDAARTEKEAGEAFPALPGAKGEDRVETRREEQAVPSERSGASETLGVETPGEGAAEGEKPTKKNWADMMDSPTL